MRQLIVQVPRGCGKEVLDIAKAYDGENLAQLEAMGTEKPLDVVIVHIPNQKVEEFLDKLEALPDLHITLNPRGVIALEPPANEAPQQVTN
ncbi:MAG: TIGR00341 family protein, partial [Coleofasciculaceae cyanobacterium]